MRDPRLVLILSAAPFGMVVGAAIWLAVGGSTPATRRLADLDVTLGPAPAAGPVRRAPSGAQAAFLAPRPLFVTESASSNLQPRATARSSQTQPQQLARLSGPGR